MLFYLKETDRKRPALHGVYPLSTVAPSSPSEHMILHPDLAGIQEK
jgi:hypothetical protein